MGLRGVLWQVRWVVLAGLLLLSLAQPLVGRAGLPTWNLILVFVLYNLALKLLRPQTTLLNAPATLPRSPGSLPAPRRRSRRPAPAGAGGGQPAGQRPRAHADRHNDPHHRPDDSGHNLLG